MKGKLTQSKKQLEKLYSSRENIDDSMSIQRPSYDKTSLGYLINMSSDDKIESSQSSKKPKEVEKTKEAKILDEPK